MLAAIRPDSWNFPLLVHVLGAMLLFGFVTCSAGALALGRGLAGVAFRSLLFGAVPSYVLMRAGAEWIRSKEGFTGDMPAWIDIGYLVADGGAAVLLVALVLTGVAARRRAGGLATVAAALSVLLIAAYVVALWAMAAKP